MDKFGKSQSVARVEDARLLTGRARYVDNIAPENALHAFVFRSFVAHAEITNLDVSMAAEAEGVHAVITQADLRAAGLDAEMSYTSAPMRDGSQAPRPKRPILAEGRVRFVGEAIAVVIAETVEQAKDAAELIEFEYDDLPVHLELCPGGETLHADCPDNRAFDYGLGDAEAAAEALENAARVVRLEVGDNRIIANSMEPRGCFAELEEGRLHLSFGGQGVWRLKDEMMRVLGLGPEEFRVTNPDVGGGFGMKAMNYPEYFVIAHAARLLNRPVRWISERTEAMLSDNSGRDLVSMAELGFDENNRITGYRLHTFSNLGAYNSGFAQIIQSQLFSRVLTGVYDIPAAYMRCEGIYTNTTQVDAYRGAGRPEAIYLLERIMDRAARELAVDPLELRRINFIRPDQFPYDTIPGETYDVGDFDRVLKRAEAEADLAGFAARRAASEADGKLRGLGLCYYIESILGAPNEDVKVEFTDEGGAILYVGTQSNGQGHETVFTSFLSDHTGIPMDKIEVVQGDSDLIARGGGTGGSRSVTVQTNVTLSAVSAMISGFAGFLAEQSSAAETDVSFDDERFRIAGSNVSPTMLEVAQMARDAGRTDLLNWEASETLPGRSFPNGAHFCEVEIDPETGETFVQKYTVVDDFGNLINPMLAEGQVHGGVAQGLGQALCEHVVYDDAGQLLTASFMDYAMPRADTMPMIRFATEAVPSTTNPMGMKGCGEAGTVGAMAAVANAVQDALWARGVKQADMPFTPSRVWKMLNDAKGRID